MKPSVGLWWPSGLAIPHSPSAFDFNWVKRTQHCKVIHSQPTAFAGYCRLSMKVSYETRC